MAMRLSPCQSRCPDLRRARPLFRPSSSPAIPYAPSRGQWATRSVQLVARATKAKQETAIEGPSTDLSVIYARLQRLVLPYWTECPSARWRLAGVVGLTLATTGVSVVFSYYGRDFYNALSERNADAFKLQLIKYLVAFVLGIPVFVYSDYLQARLSLEWREWMTEHLLGQYFADRSFYQLQAGALVDNPDQRIAADVRQFTDTALALSLTLLNSLVDLVSFSGILYSIYPPLFAALLAYSIGGTLGSLALGKSLVGLNFNQEAVEADLRYGLVRVRENAESIAFYGGQANEMAALKERLRVVVANYGKLLVASRNLDFFTSFYRYLIQLLPAAVVAPLFFAGKIEFGVITQSSSAFSHILNDVSLVVYQFETLAGFSAVVDRLGEFQEVVDVKLRHSHPRVRRRAAAAASLAAAVASQSAAASLSSSDAEETRPLPSPQAEGAAPASAAAAAASSSVTGAAALPADTSAGIQVVQVLPSLAQDGSNGDSSSSSDHSLLVELDDLSIQTPDGGQSLVQQLSLQVRAGASLLIMGPSGSGKTSVLRVLAGLWQSGSGTIYSYGLSGLGDPGAGIPGCSSVMFLPQRPYMVLGSLRDQLFYPTWTQQLQEAEGQPDSSDSATSSTRYRAASPWGPQVPSDERLETVLHQVQLSLLLDRCKAAAAAASDAKAADNGSSTHVTPAAHAGLPAVNGAGSAAGGAPGASALDYVADWSGMLSLGEQQRLAFARLLLAAPRLALLDEATSALDTTNEARLYQALKASGTTVISVGHRPTLISYHQTVLQLEGSQPGSPGRWRIVPAEQLKAAAAASVIGGLM